MLKLDWNILFTCINLVFFYILLKKFVWNKVLSAMEQRKAMINQQFSDADKTVEDANKLKEEYETKIEGAQQESKKILDDAKATANLKAEAIIDDAKLTSDKMINEARVSIENECQNALQSAKSNIAELAIDVAAKIVGKEAESIDNSAIYDEFLNENKED